jgi:hypothetical protein
VLVVCGLGDGDLNGVPLSDVFAILAACASAAFLSNHPTYVNVAFSHARASR